MKAVIPHIQNELKGIFPEQEIRGITRLLLEHVLQLDYSGLIKAADKDISTHQRNLIEELIQRIKNFEPVQYVTGETEFYGMKIKVNRNVLIPRPETEELVEWIVKTQPVRKMNILDIGTGSGCIALALKNTFGASQVTAADYSEEVLAVTQANSELNKLDIICKKSDIIRWEQYSWDKFDLIVSNPPYVRECEKAEMLPNVLDYEPAEALFVNDDDPFIYYRRIAEFAHEFLMAGGWLFFEINQYLGNELSSLLKKMNFAEVEIKKDIHGNDRMIRCRKSLE